MNKNHEAGIAPRLLAGRMLLGLGGLGATGSPAAATGLYTWWHGPDKALDFSVGKKSKLSIIFVPPKCDQQYHEWMKQLLGSMYVVLFLSIFTV